MATSTIMSPKVVSREEWTLARKELLAKEKELTRQRDAINAARRLTVEFSNVSMNGRR